MATLKGNLVETARHQHLFEVHGDENFDFPMHLFICYNSISVFEYFDEISKNHYSTMS